MDRVWCVFSERIGDIDGEIDSQWLTGLHHIVFLLSRLQALIREEVATAAWYLAYALWKAWYVGCHSYKMGFQIEFFGMW